MLFLKSTTTNPYFNIATEEYLLKNFDQDFFFLYINEPCIIVGKHQNAIAEINVPYVVENDLKVVRRLSGGGTVFHDHGNLNYCFIQRGKEGFLVDFEKYSQPILNALNKLGVNAYLRGKSDLVINDLKFSGNAEHVYRKKILHHGTLLFSSQLSNLNEAIKVDWNKFEDRAVRSNRSKVTNISEHLSKDMSLSDFADAVKQEAFDGISQIEEYTLSPQDIAAISVLVDEKYSQWEWAFGYSPKYKIKQAVTIEGFEFHVLLEIKNGIIQEAQISIGGELKNAFDNLANKLKNEKHDYHSLIIIIKAFLESQPSINLNAQKLMQLFF